MDPRPDLRLKASDFNTLPSTVMHVDLNSCFATIEQQANPRLRGKPIVVAAYPTGGGCILAPSFEAKKLGIKTGMRVREAQKICPQIKILTPDPPKYRYVNRLMMKIFQRYSPLVFPKSIDEAVIVFDWLNKDHPLKKDLKKDDPCATVGAILSPEAKVIGVYQNLFDVARQIKARIKSEIGEYLTVSIGLGPNRFLAKTAAGLKKPDGLEEINHKNIVQIFEKLKVEDLCGIGLALKLRLNDHGIFSALDFLNAKHFTLDAIFCSINAYHWYQRLRGFEVDAWETARKSIGHSYALPKATSDPKTLEPVLLRLCEKVGRRLRGHNLEAQGIYLSIVYKGGGHFGQSRKLTRPIFSTLDLFYRSFQLLTSLNHRPISILAVGVFNLSPSLYQQQTLFETPGVNGPVLNVAEGLDSGSLSFAKKKSLWQALDKINNKFGEFIIGSGLSWGLEKKIKDRIAFGGIRDLN